MFKVLFYIWMILCQRFLNLARSGKKKGLNTRYEQRGPEKKCFKIRAPKLQSGKQGKN